MALGAVALGKRFRLFSFLMAVTLLAFGTLTGIEAPKLALGEPTPFMGLYERVSFTAWLVWLVAPAIALLRASTRTCSGPESEHDALTAKAV